MAKYIAVTHIDRKTGVPGFEAPMKNGPVYPNVKGLNIEWWDLSRWPITHPDDYPLFYGTCDDDADLDLKGVMRVFEDNPDTGVTALDTYNELREQEYTNRLPAVVTPRQIRLALLDEGLLDSVQNIIDTLDEPLRSKANIEWEYSLNIDKYSPLVQKLYPLLGLTTEQLDDLFTKAAESYPTRPDE